MKLVSVVITTKNSGRTIERLLKSIKKQTYPKIETIIVDNGSSDNTTVIAKKYMDKIFQKGPERSAQRNFGAQKAVGKYLLFLDSDMVLKKDVVKRCVEMVDKEIGGIIIPEQSFGEGIWAKAKTLEREINRGENYFESARFIPKKIFWEFNGFDEEMTGPEDWDLPRRIGKKYKITRADSLIYHDEGNLSILTLLRKKFYYGLSADKFLKKQKLPIIGPSTIYFLRSAFYKKWRLLLRDPIVTLSMLIMLFIEFIGGGLGYLIGKFKNEN